MTQPEPDDTARDTGPGSEPVKTTAKPTPVDADWDRDEGADWRHAPRPAKDESPLESFGKSIGEVVTGASDDASGKPTSDPAEPRKP